MAIRLGVDTLCWHLRLEHGAISVAEIIDEAAALGAECVQVNLHHVRELRLDDCRNLAELARDRDMRLLASGDFVGAAREGDSPDVGRDRITGWLERAVALESSFLRVVSGFYRTDLIGRPELIDAERRYVAAVLRFAAPIAGDAGITLLLENHSDFTVSEYESIVAEVPENVRVFLDLINPVAALEDPLPVVERLSPLAPAGHVKDYSLTSVPTDDGYHRRGFDVRYCYPGEGVADLPRLLAALHRGLRAEDFFLTIEGLDNRVDVSDQRSRLESSLHLLRRLCTDLERGSI